MTDSLATMPTGHIKLARKAFDLDHGDPFWMEHRTFSRWEAWVYVIQLAAFKQRRYETGFGVVELERGEFVASLRFLAARFKWNLKSVRGWVASCQKGARLRAQRETQAGTVYLIVNYDAYQPAGKPKGTAKGTPKGTARAQRGHKREEGEEGKEVKQQQTADNDAVFCEAWAAYPFRPNNSKLAAWRQWMARVREGVDPLDMLEGARRYASFCKAAGTNPRFIKTAATFFGRDRHFAAAEAAPPPPDWSHLSHLSGYPAITHADGTFTEYGEYRTRPKVSA